MKRTYNIYCDESTHIESDGHPYMILSYISTPYHLLKMHNKNIRDMKIEHFYRGEMKWSSISKSQYPFYSKLIDYFFSNDELNFRAIIIDKSQLNHKAFNQDHNIFYDKMYYQLLNKKIDPNYNYNIYLDIKDTYSYLKARSLKKYLERDYNNIRNLQIIRSYESELMQLSDVLMGAINYKLRGLNKVTAKNNIIEKIEKLRCKPLTMRNKEAEKKFNLFFIDLKNAN
ncbi:RlfA protein [Flavobacterium sp. VMW]|nr:RlfA protein [Flavobacterium sp. VMW]